MTSPAIKENAMQGEDNVRTQYLLEVLIIITFGKD